ncbi:hypothetical protein [Burkholderia anthina]|uniref:hypothetical protein n=1 Tax=Burkholderia anthina TaxID=179879 RepID=UPI00158E5804|nr:hypothetical protein [Burkholderia anthina]
MSIATILRRWLAGMRTAAQAGAAGSRMRGAGRARAMPHARALRWRGPWLRWQLLSWVALTMLAPPVWSIGTLLLINPSSDQPFFWAAAMAIVPIANGIAIVAANQHHHRTPFISRRAVAAHCFGVAMTLACALFALLLWRADAIAALIGPFALSAGGPRDASLAAWVAALVAGFGFSSSAHASMLHAWLAFEA